MKLFFLFVFCFFLPVSWSQPTSISSLETSYVLLNVNTSQTALSGSFFTPPTHHYIEIPNIDFTSFTTGFSIEGWVLWRGTNLCTNPRKTPPCSGIDNAPLFLMFKDNSTYFYFTPAVNSSLTGGAFNYEYGYNFLSVSSSSFAQSFSFLGNYNSPFTPTSVSGFDWAHVSFSWQPSGNSELVITPLESQGLQVLFTPSYTYTLSWSGWNPSSLGVTSLYIGGFDTTVPPPPGTAANFLLANVAEIRIWNKFRTTSEVLSTQQSSLNGNEPNLVHYWRLNEPSGNTVFDSAGSNNGFLKYQTGDTYLPSRTLNSQPETIVYSSPSFDNLCFFSLNNILRTLNATSTYNFGTTATMRNSVINVQFSSPVSNLTGSLSTSCPQSDYNVICDNTFSFSPSRQYCGTTSNLILNYQYTSGTTTLYSTNTTFVFNINSLGAPVITNALYSTPTTGGTVTFSGSNFGADGPLASNEYLTISINSNNITCNGAVSSNTIQCIIPPGVGTGGTVVFSSCGSVATFPNFFSYDPPSISSASGTNQSTLIITGQNFGTFPSQVTVQILTSNGVIPCIVDIVTETQITCNNNNILTSGQNYNITVTVAGQTGETVFTYDICEFPCQNGGKCVGFNKCDCSGLSYGGNDCSQPISCSPVCKNNGICINNNANVPVCNCTVGFSGADCASGVQGTTNNEVLGVALGVAAAFLVVIIVLIIVVIIILRRRPKRYTGELWVPLEKKDFEKIIYGEQLQENPPGKGSGDLKALEQMLLEEDLKLVTIISELTQITEADKVAKALVIIFQAHDKVLKLLEKFIVDEVAATENAGNLFRSNSMVSKMFKFYSRLIGLPYLYVTIGPEITQLVAEQIGLEVDPEKMDDGADLDEMRWTLMAQSQKILKQILNSSDNCPTEFRELFVHIEKAVKGRYPENVRTTIGGFIFLRFFCPAVSSPEAYGILDEPPSASSRRLLILITKVLQNLSNDVEFGAKEPYMTKMNDFVQANRDKLSKFYDKLLKPSPKDLIQVDLPKNIKAVSLGVISQHIRSILDKMEDKELRAKLDEIVVKE